MKPPELLMALYRGHLSHSREATAMMFDWMDENDWHLLNGSSNGIALIHASDLAVLQVAGLAYPSADVPNVCLVARQLDWDDWNELIRVVPDLKASLVIPTPPGWDLK
jgi:hypothetical protein